MATNVKHKSQWKDDVDVWSSPVVANMLWVLLSIPVITAPLAFTGLLACMFHWTDQRRTQVITLFAGTIKKTWYKAYILFVIDIAVLAFLTFNFVMFQFMDMGDVFAIVSRSASLLVLILFLIVNIPAWVLISVWDAPLLEILKFSVRLVFAQPVWTTLTALSFFLTFAVSLVFPAFLLIVGTGAIASYFACKGTIHLLKIYMERDEFRLIDLD